MSKQELFEVAQSLHIKTEGQTKTQIIKQILGLPMSVSADTQPEIKLDTEEVFADAQAKILADPQAKVLADLPKSTEGARFLDPQMMEYNLEMKRLELQQQKMALELRALELTGSTQIPQANQSSFKVETASKLLPKLGSDSELEVYLITFKKIATLNNWPKEHWSAVLQTQLKGKALRIFAELPDDVIQDFDQLQNALLTAYELSPEHYRKRFRDIRKSDSENYTDFAFKMQNYFKRWLNSLDSYHDIDKLRQTLLMEQFLETVSVELKIWLVDQKPKNVDEMARLADQYVALRKQSIHGQKTSTDPQKVSIAHNTSLQKGFQYSKPQEYGQRNATSPKKTFKPYKQQTHTTATKSVTCAYCKKPNHTISECKKLKQKQETDKIKTQSVNTNSFSNTFTRHSPVVSVHNVNEIDKTPHPLFVPYCKPAQIIRTDGSRKQIHTLRDTGAMQSLIKDTQDSHDYIITGETRLLKGITNDTLTVPLVEVHLQTDFLDEKVLCGLVKDLPDGIDFLIGNDIWLQGHPLPDEVIEQAVLTRAAARKVQNPPNDDQHTPEDDHFSENDHLMGTPLNLDASIDSVTDRTKLIELQKADPNLAHLRQKALENQNTNEMSYFYIQDDMLMHHLSDRKTNLSANRIVVPTALRLQVMRLAHDIPAAGHLGIRKTINRLQPHFHWPRMLKDVTHFCKSCDFCQKEGKGRKIPPAPLISVPLMSEPWSRIAIDIVGPLPVCPKTGNRFILTCMDLATHYPEAVPLKNHTAEEVANALAQIFSHFGLPEEILSDQGTEFMSELMQHFLFQFGIKQIRASPYHPETNGSCERFHRTLKSMIRAMVNDFNDSWCECLPWALFAYREIPVETLGFSPFELMYGYSVRGPLSLLRSTWSQNPLPTGRAKQSVIKYMLDMRERIAKCSDIAMQIAENARSTAKTWYDRNARSRHFDEGDLVLVLLPVTGKPLQCKYQGPYRIVRQLGPVDYVIATPDKRKTERTCHVNMLKPYVQRNLLNVDSTPETIDICTTDIQTSNTDPLSKFKFDGLKPEKQEELKQLLTEFSDIFSDDPGKTTLTKHEIHLESGTRPIKLPPYRVSTQKSEIIKKELDNMIQLGVIEPSSSPWAAPVVVIPKPDKTYRFCVDYRRLNEVTVPDAFPMPRIDDLIDKVGKAKYLTKIDLSKGYWQVPMDEEAIPMSAFVTPFGHFQWKFMPFGLRNAPATFQKLVQKVLLGLDTFTAAYLDDILIFSESWHEHICHIKEVLKRIRQAGLTIKACKCDFATAEVDYLGHTIGLGKVAPRNAKVLALQNFPRPNNKKQLQSFLGLAGYYRKFLPHFAHITACLTNMLKKGTKFAWDEEAEAAFLDLKSRLASRPILRPPDFSRPFCIAVDASDVAVGACLFQEIDEVEHPIAYYSKKLNDHQKNYSVVEKEALALILATRTFSVYLDSHKVMVYTDHSPLQFLQRMANHNQKLLRWALELQQYTLEIRHRPGTRNWIPDILSRPSS